MWVLFWWRAAHTFLPPSSCSRPERAETDRPRQLGGPVQGWDGPRRASVRTHHHSEEVPADTQSQDWLHGGKAEWFYISGTSCLQAFIATNLLFFPSYNLLSWSSELLSQAGLKVFLEICVCVFSTRFCQNLRPSRLAAIGSSPSAHVSLPRWNKVD